MTTVDSKYTRSPYPSRPTFSHSQSEYYDRRDVDDQSRASSPPQTPPDSAFNPHSHYRHRRSISDSAISIALPTLDTSLSPTERPTGIMVTGDMVATLTYLSIQDNVVLNRTSFGQQYPKNLDPPSGLTTLRCLFCSKKYSGPNARSMWRRHVSGKHEFELSGGKANGKVKKHPSELPLLKSPWNGASSAGAIADENRPFTPEEKRLRLLETKRKAARIRREANRRKVEEEDPYDGYGALPFSPSDYSPRPERGERADTNSVSPSNFFFRQPTRDLEQSPEVPLRDVSSNNRFRWPVESPNPVLSFTRAAQSPPSTPELSFNTSTNVGDDSIEQYDPNQSPSAHLLFQSPPKRSSHEEGISTLLSPLPIKDSAVRYFQNSMRIPALANINSTLAPTLQSSSQPVASSSRAPPAIARPYTPPFPSTHLGLPQRQIQARPYSSMLEKERREWILALESPDAATKARNNAYQSRIISPLKQPTTPQHRMRFQGFQPPNAVSPFSGLMDMALGSGPGVSSWAVAEELLAQCQESPVLKRTRDQQDAYQNSAYAYGGDVPAPKRLRLS